LVSISKIFSSTGMQNLGDLVFINNHVLVIKLNNM